MNTTTEIENNKPNVFTLLQKIGGSFLLVGLLAYFVAESIFASMFISEGGTMGAIIMTYIVDVMGVILAIFFIVWINVQEHKKEKALKNAFSCLFFYIFLFSICQFFFPVFYEGPFPDPSLISIYFNMVGLNFTGLIVMTALSLTAFIYVTIKPKDEVFSANQKLIGTLLLLILVIISTTMIYQFRATINFGFVYYFLSSYVLDRIHLFFTNKIAELIIVVLIVVLTLLTIILKNKTIKLIMRNIVLLTIGVAYLALTGINGIIFSVPEPILITTSIGNLLFCIGGPLLVIGSLVSLGMQIKQMPKSLPVEISEPIIKEQIISDEDSKPKAKKSKVKVKKQEKVIEQPKEEPVATQEQPVETEGYDELFETGLYHIRNGEYDRAIEYWERCVKVKPDFLPGWNNLGLAYKDLEQIDKAISCWSKALEIDPNYTEASHNLEVALLLKRKRRL
ncbi:MAG: tetratricopeptide repeat protein [Candidatus Heimdallarchaeota archaeon]